MIFGIELESRFYKMKLSYLITENKPLTIEDYLRQASYSKKLISAIKYQGGHILLNGCKKQVETALTKGDVLDIVFPIEVMNETIPLSKKPISIVYEDDYVLIVNKEALVPTIPSKLHYIDSLAGRVKYYYQDKGIQANIHFVNRLDKGTSGLVLIAKHRFIHHLFSQVEIDKTYLGIVCGHLTGVGMIDAPIKRESDESIKRIVHESGQDALTSYQTLSHVYGYSFVQLRLYTGRTHQIRVHLCHIGYPLVGDSLYGTISQAMNRHALHASNLSFIHPITLEAVNVGCEIPEDMKSLME
jgi:23S rRNA pseudouridine1911/1915/1917 synthase